MGLWDMDPEPRVGGGGVRPKAEKKKWTLINSMGEVVSNVPVATSAGFS